MRIQMRIFWQNNVNRRIIFRIYISYIYQIHSREIVIQLFANIEILSSASPVR